VDKQATGFKADQRTCLQDVRICAIGKVRLLFSFRLHLGSEFLSLLSPRFPVPCTRRTVLGLAWSGRRGLPRRSNDGSTTDDSGRLRSVGIDGPGRKRRGLSQADVRARARGLCRPEARALRHVRSVCAQGQALRLQAADVLPQEGGLCAGSRGLVCPGSRLLLLRRTRYVRRTGKLSRPHPSGLHATLMAELPDIDPA